MMYEKQKVGKNERKKETKNHGWTNRQSKLWKRCSEVIKKTE